MINDILGHENTIPDGVDGAKMQDHTGEVEAETKVVDGLVGDWNLDIELTGGQNGNAKDGLNEQKEQCLEVVLGLIFREQMVLLLVLRDQWVVSSRVVVHVHGLLPEVLYFFAPLFALIFELVIHLIVELVLVFTFAAH